MRNWGDEPGSLAPELYWQPWLAHNFGLRPADLGDMTPHQLDDCRKFIEKANKQRRS